MQSANPARMARLDGLRGLAATGVMLHHIFFFLLPWQFAALPFSALAEWLHHYGWTLVDLFFVLSGYVFAHVYLQDDHLQTNKGMAAFWVARIARLWPLHLTILVVIALFGPPNKADTFEAFVAQLFMLQAFVKPVAGTYDWSSWSLSVEVFCYAVFCAANRHGRLVLLWVSGMMIGLALIGFAELSHPGGPFAGSVIRRGLLGFFIGQTLWHARGYLANVPWPVLVGGMLAGILLENGQYSPALSLTVLTWPCVLLLSLRLKPMEHPAMVWLGDRSYAIYLINLPLVQAVDLQTEGHKFGLAEGVGVQAAIVITVLIAAHLSYRHIEAPSRRAIRQYWARREQQQGQADCAAYSWRG